MKITEVDKENLKSYMLNPDHGSGPLKEELRIECTELEECKNSLRTLQAEMDEASASKNDVVLLSRMKEKDRKRIVAQEKIIGTLIEKYNVSLERLWDKNFPDIKIVSQSRETTYTSTHQNTIVEGVLPTPSSDNFQPAQLSEPSKLLSNLVSTKWKYTYHNENMIADGVKYFVDDIMMLLDLQTRVRIVPENTFDGKRSDLWILKTTSGVPFLPIECKQPGTFTGKDGSTKSILAHPKVLGQCYFYMQQLRSSFGQQVVYGIITTLEEWRILYLPNDSASTLTPSSSSSSSSSLANSTNSIAYQENKVSASEVYSLNRKGDLQSLFTTIANAIRLSHDSSHVPVPLISENRGYIVFEGDKFVWGTLTPSLLQKKFIKFDLPKSGSNLSITILRSFLGGADGMTYLGLTQNFHLVVVKKFTNVNDDNTNVNDDNTNVNDDNTNVNDDNPNAYGKERKYWPLTTNIKTVSLGKEQNILILPFAFTCLRAKDKTPYFDFDLNKWGGVSENIVEDNRFTDLSEKFQNFYHNNRSNLAPEHALKSAVELFASKNCVHEDIEWRHVALLPQVKIKKKIVEVTGLTPIFIDLSRVKVVDDSQTARNEMSDRVNSLMYDLAPKVEEDQEEEKETKDEELETEIPSHQQQEQPQPPSSPQKKRKLSQKRSRAVSIQKRTSSYNDEEDEEEEVEISQPPTSTSRQIKDVKLVSIRQDEEKKEDQSTPAQKKVRVTRSSTRLNKGRSNGTNNI